MASDVDPITPPFTLSLSKKRSPLRRRASAGSARTDWCSALQQVLIRGEGRFAARWIADHRRRIVSRDRRDLACLGDNLAARLRQLRIADDDAILCAKPALDHAQAIDDGPKLDRLRLRGAV